MVCGATAAESGDAACETDVDVEGASDIGEANAMLGDAADETDADDAADDSALVTGEVCLYVCGRSRARAAFFAC